MARSSTLLAGSLLCAVVGCAGAAETAPAPAGENPTEATIPFANRGGVVDWQVADDSTLLLRDSHGQWYRARLQVPLPAYSPAERLGFATGPSGTLEKLDSVVIRGQRYPIVSLIRVGPPAKKAK